MRLMLIEAIKSAIDDRAERRRDTNTIAMFAAIHTCSERIALGCNCRSARHFSLNLGRRKWRPFLVPDGRQLSCARQPGYAFDVMDRPSRQKGWIAMLSALIGVLIIVVIGAICFWAIDKFARDRRLTQLLKLLVVLICIAAILQRVLPLLGIYI